MFIRYKHWEVDGLETHTKQLGLSQLVFEDANQGVLDVRKQAEIEALLREPSQRYQLAYDMYGVSFDAQGVEIPVSHETATDAPPIISCEPAPVRPRGRPKRR